MQFRAMRDGYRSMFPHGQFSIVLVDGAAAGRVVVDRRANEIHVVDIVISAAQRGRGIGSEIMKTIMMEARAAGKPVRLAGAEAQIGRSLFIAGSVLP